MDLKAMFGKRYVVTLEDSWAAETPENRAEFLAGGDLWWYYEIKGRRGVVYPYSKSEIAVVLPLRAARLLVQLMGAELIKLQHGDDAICYKADLKQAEALVRFIQPKSCRQLTEAHKAALAARLALYRSRRPRPSQINPTSEIKLVPQLPGVGS